MPPGSAATANGLKEESDAGRMVAVHRDGEQIEFCKEFEHA